MKKGSTSDLVEDINKKYDPETIKKTLIKFHSAEAFAVANECGGKVYELGLIKVR